MEFARLDDRRAVTPQEVAAAIRATGHVPATAVREIEYRTASGRAVSPELRALARYAEEHPGSRPAPARGVPIATLEALLDLD